MARYNESKLRRLVNHQRAKNAEYRALQEDVRFVKSNVGEFERLLKEVDEKTEVMNNREVFLARTEKREPREIKLFLSYPTDELLDVFKNHPINQRASLQNVRQYVNHRKELEALIERMREIEAEMRPINQLVINCKNFLEQNGVSYHGLTI